jgi:putative oxidoreductase
MSKVFSASPLWQTQGLVLIRIVTGLLVAYHGWEIFDEKLMSGYLEWDSIKSLPWPKAMVYFGKGLELVAGVCLAIGLFTRLAALFIFIDMMFICFKVGQGRFYYEDQHPFLFGVLALVFFFTGPVKFGVDNYLFKQKRKY